MVGFFYIDIKNKRIRVRMPNVVGEPHKYKDEWFKSKFKVYGKKIAYDKAKCEWILHRSKETVRKLIEQGFDTEPWTFNYLYGPLDRTWKTLPLKEQTMFLRGFQRTALRYLVAHKGRGLLAMSPGLGKTPTSLAYAIENEDALPIVVVCPATVKEQWKASYHEFIGDGDVRVLYGINSLDCMAGADAVIINYDILARHITKVQLPNDKLGRKRSRYEYTPEFARFMETGFKYMIIDECHKIKDTSGKSKSYKAVKKLSENIPYVVALSGTPFENNPAELFNTLEILRPDIYRNRMYFFNRYCGPENNGFGVKYTKATLIPELSRMLADTVMHRAKKENVLNDLPPVMTSIIPFKLKKYKDYLKYRQELNEEVHNKTSKLIAANKFEKLLQKASELKMKPSLDFIDDLLLKKDKVVVFCWHKLTVDAIQAHYAGKSVQITGSTSSSKRSSIKDEFVHNPDKRVFIGNIMSAGTGLDGLQKVCDTVVFMELTWKSTSIDQAIDRINRMGFKGESIFVYYLIALDTVEEDLASLIDRKRKLFDKVMDGEDTDQFDLLEELIYMDKKRGGL